MSASQFPNETFLGADTGAIDPRVLDELRELGGDDDPGLLLELIDLFLADAPRQLEEMSRGFATNDARLLERAAHTLKSSSANLGAMTLSSLCKRMEEIARENELAGVRPLLHESQQHWPRVVAALRAARS